MRLKELRKKRNLTQAQLGKLVGTSPQQISRWEKDDVIPSVKYLVQLQQVLGREIYTAIKPERTLENCYELYSSLLSNTIEVSLANGARTPFYIGNHNHVQNLFEKLSEHDCPFVEFNTVDGLTLMFNRHYITQINNPEEADYFDVEPKDLETIEVKMKQEEKVVTKKRRVFKVGSLCRNYLKEDICDEDICDEYLLDLYLEDESLKEGYSRAYNIIYLKNGEEIYLESFEDYSDFIDYLNSIDQEELDKSKCWYSIKTTDEHSDPEVRLINLNEIMFVQIDCVSLK